jgi:5'-3' exoribonuclease 1
MGIPSYFSYIIKNYPNIIRKFNACGPFHHLFMDCNSIVYDAYNSIEKKHAKHPVDVSKIESLILNQVVENIKGYIRFVSPKYSVFITFDGVAPFAKMSQQKTDHLSNHQTLFTRMIIYFLTINPIFNVFRRHIMLVF